MRMGFHDPANELYDRACDLLAAAEALSPAAARPGAAPAIAATLGCVEAALDALVTAAAAMRGELSRQLSRDESVAAERASGVSHDTTQRELSALIDALIAARDAADVMRCRTGPLLAQLTAPPTG
jgi:hypothetical protein